MKKVVIFGGAGSIGLSLIKYLLSEGKYEITVVDLKNKETIKRLKKYKKRVNIIYSDCFDRGLIDFLIKTHDYVINLASCILPLANYKEDLANKIEYGAQRVYPEILLSRVSPDGELRIAGQADLVIIDGFDVHILDYKTSKKIDKKSYYDRKKRRSQMMKYPLNNIEDTNFWHYSLQLSTYAWMIEKMDPRFNIKSLTIIHYDHGGGVTYHECQYLKNDVERMLSDYKRKIKHDEFKKSREKVLP